MALARDRRAGSIYCMIRLLSIFGVFMLAISACKKDEDAQLQVYIAEKEARPGLQQANFSGFKALGYIPDKPDLIISKLEKVTFAPSQIQTAGPKPSEGVKDDRTTLVLQLTKSDADALSELTKKHIGDRLVVLLNNEPLFAPEIRTPSIGESVYVRPPPGADTSGIKAKLETLAEATK